MPPVPTCKHVKANGELCGCPALRNRDRCYFHHDSKRRARASSQAARHLTPRGQRAVNLPVLEDANAVQVALMETIHGLLDGRLTERHTGLLLYALQTASANLKHTSFSAAKQKQPEPWVTALLDALRALPDDNEYPSPDTKPAQENTSAAPSKPAVGLGEVV